MFACADVAGIMCKMVVCADDTPFLQKPHGGVRGTAVRRGLHGGAGELGSAFPVQCVHPRCGVVPPGILRDGAYGVQTGSDPFHLIPTVTRC